MQDIKGSVMKTNRLSRRQFLRLAGAATGSAALAACGSVRSVQPGVTPHKAGQIQLVYQDWRTDWFPPMVQQMLAEFHATHPGIRVFYVPDPENLEEKMLADFQAGTAPDVFQGCCAHFPIWARHVRVCLCIAQAAVSLDICDDGKGFALDVARESGGFGLSGMKARAARIGGTLKIDSTPGKGTTVSVAVPALNPEPVGDKA